MNWQAINDFVRRKSLNLANKESQKLKQQFQHLNHENWSLPVQVRNDHQSTDPRRVYFNQRSCSLKLPIVNTRKPGDLQPKALSNDEIKAKKPPPHENKALKVQRLEAIEDRLGMNPRAIGRIKLEPIKLSVFS